MRDMAPKSVWREKGVFLGTVGVCFVGDSEKVGCGSSEDWGVY